MTLIFYPYILPKNDPCRAILGYTEILVERPIITIYHYYEVIIL